MSEEPKESVWWWLAAGDPDEGPMDPGGIFDQPWASKGPDDPDSRLALRLILLEWVKALRMAPPMMSPHAGVSMMRAEFDGLWEAIKADDDIVTIRTQAAQVGAMALRFLVDVCNVR